MNDKKRKINNTQMIASDGKDVEFSEELADQEDMEALRRSEAADQRAKRKTQE